MKKQLILGSLIAMAGITNAQNVFNTAAGTNVGIGTLSPTQPLHVITSNVDAGILVKQNNSSNGGSWLYLDNISGRKWGLGSTGSANNVGGGHFIMYDFNTGADRFFINGTSGNVGFGTTSPSAKLQVQGSGQTEVYSYATSANRAGFWAMNQLNSYGFIVDASGLGHITNNINGPVVNLLNFNQYNSTGQVWIGNTKPVSPHNDFQFAVAGKVVAQSIYVTATYNWADYVFAPEYKLPKLNDVESFYKANRHLPEVPTAKEVAEKGIDVGEMNTVLLKKVEELTLYMVDLNKKVESIQKENEELKKQINK